MQKETLAGRSWVSLPIWLGEGELSRQREESTFYSLHACKWPWCQAVPCPFLCPHPQRPQCGDWRHHWSLTHFLFSWSLGWQRGWGKMFLLFLPFQRAIRNLTVNALAGAHISLVSGYINSCKYPAWRPLPHGLWNVNRAQWDSISVFQF